MKPEMVAIIEHKRDGKPLSAEMIEYWIEGVVKGGVPEYQSAALLMAIRLCGMTPRETAILTHAMARGGEQTDWEELPGIRVDKHSTGGVGDSVTLIAIPLAAACGARIVKMSGRGLGYTGGTLDKLAAIPGFDPFLPMEDALRVAREAGAVLIGQSTALCPADKRLYALRDVTATADSLPLIASSIMSKKLATRCDALVLDIKVGTGALLPDEKSARELASIMLDIAADAGLACTVFLTDMNVPLGDAVGNALETAEAMAVLGGSAGPLAEVSIELAAAMVAHARGIAMDVARADVRAAWIRGDGVKKMEYIIALQGGDPRVARDPGLLPQAERIVEVGSPGEGWVSRLDARAIGETARALGAGRSNADDPIDPAAGVLLRKRVGDHVNQGETVLELHVGKGYDETAAMVCLRNALEILKTPVAPAATIIGALGLPG